MIEGSMLANHNTNDVPSSPIEPRSLTKQDSQAALSYMADMLNQMADMAEETGCSTLSELLRVAHNEASLQMTLFES